MFVWGLVGCEMAKEVTLSLQWDGLAESTLCSSSHLPKCTPLFEYFVLPVSDCGAVFTDVARAAGEVTPPGIFYQLVNSYQYARKDLYGREAGKIFSSCTGVCVCAHFSVWARRAGHQPPQHMACT